MVKEGKELESESIKCLLKSHTGRSQARLDSAFLVLLLSASFSEAPENIGLKSLFHPGGPQACTAHVYISDCAIALSCNSHAMLLCSLYSKQWRKRTMVTFCHCDLKKQ